MNVSEINLFMVKVNLRFEKKAKILVKNLVFMFFYVFMFKVPHRTLPL